MYWIWLLLIILVIVLYNFREKFGLGQQSPDHKYAGEPWISQIMDGSKTIDVRPGKLEKYEMLVGSTAVYYNKKQGKEITVKVTKVNHYSSLKELVKNEDLSQMAPHIKTAAQFIETMHTYFSDERIEEIGGINAIHIKRT